MPTEKPKIIFVVDQELLERLDDYRYANRIPNRSESIRRLLESALKAWEEEQNDRK
jgi:metal-responsive CopG/Arc/MetJ family transcriptional regulator